MRICTENFLKFMFKTKLLHQNFLLIFQKSLTSNIFLDTKEGDNPPLPHAHVWINHLYRLKISRFSILVWFLVAGRTEQPALEARACTAADFPDPAGPISSSLGVQPGALRRWARLLRSWRDSSGNKSSLQTGYNM